jgi:hypothetical protein
VYARAPLAATAMAGRRGAFPRAEVPAWVGEARVVVVAGMAVGAGGGNRSGSLAVCKTLKWREAVCYEQS